jgi:hypothetical protein
MRDLEGESRDRLFEEGDRGFRGLVVLHCQMHAARAAVDGPIEITLAALAISRSQLRQMFDVEVHEAEIILLEGASLPFSLLRRWQPPQAFGLEDAIDGIAVEMRQEMRDHEGEVIERKAGGAAQRTDDRPLFLGGFPGQRVRPAGAVLAVCGPALAPLADRLRIHPIALGQDTGGLG